MNWRRGQLPDLIVKYGKSYLLIQQDFNNPGNTRINYLKTDLIT
jgi:hypothetical protein